MNKSEGSRPTPIDDETMALPYADVIAQDRLERWEAGACIASTTTVTGDEYKLAKAYLALRATQSESVQTFAPAELLDKCIMALSGEYVEKPDDAGEEWNAAVGYCIGKLRVMQEQLPSVASSAGVQTFPVDTARLNDLLARVPYDDVVYDTPAHRWMNDVASLLGELRVASSATEPLQLLREITTELAIVLNVKSPGIGDTHPLVEKARAYLSAIADSGGVQK